MKVVAATVTYNSSESLKKTIRALLNQTYVIYKIVITDNNSNEGNKTNLREIQSWAPEKIDIIWLNNNTGGAGGFYESVRYSRDRYDPDWYWLMDDDAYPDENTLEVLISKISKLDNVGFVAPVIWGIDKKAYQLYHARKQKGLICKFDMVADSIDTLPDILKIDVDAFVGPLISKNAVKLCGLPRAEFFIEGDDTDYTYRITRLFNGYLVKDTKMNHRDLPSNQGDNPSGWWKQYYWFRNSILFAKYNLKGLSKFLSIIHFLLFAYKYKCKIRREAKSAPYFQFRWSILKEALIDGLRGHSGASLLPVDYKKQLQEWESKHLEEKCNV